MKNNPSVMPIPSELQELAGAECVGPMNVVVTEITVQGAPAKQVALRQEMRNGTVAEFGFTAKGDLAKLHDNELVNLVTQHMLARLLNEDTALVREQ